MLECYGLRLARAEDALLLLPIGHALHPIPSDAFDVLLLPSLPPLLSPRPRPRMVPLTNGCDYRSRALGLLSHDSLTCMLMIVSITYNTYTQFARYPSHPSRLLEAHVRRPPVYMILNLAGKSFPRRQQQTTDVARSHSDIMS